MIRPTLVHDVSDQTLPRLVAGDDEIEVALAQANLPTLLLVLAHLTQDAKWLEEPFVPTRARALDDNDSGGFDAETQAVVRSAARDVLVALREGRQPVPGPPSPEELIRRLSIAMGEPVPPEYGVTFSEETGFEARAGMDWTAGRPAGADRLKVLVIGAGPAGISVSRMLLGLGLDFEVLERQADVGGVWHANDYPGAGVDTPSHMYSFSFAPNRGWHRYYAKQPEILAYLRETAERCGVLGHVRFGTEVLRMDWDADAAEWVVLSDGPGGRQERRASVVISCVGLLSRPKIPRLPGMERFGGPIFHSSEWDHDVDVTGMKVAVIGTGATAMQIVPAIADAAAKTLVFQRSPQWVAPNDNYLREVPEGVRLLMEHLPYYASFYRLRLTWQFQDKLLATLYRDPSWSHPERSVNAINDRHRAFFIEYLERELEGRPDLIEKVTPTYPPYGKRILMDNDWFKTLRRPDVELIAEDVAGFDDHTVVTRCGEHIEADIVVLATGFHATRVLWPTEVHGRDGVSLHEQWGDDDAYAYLGVGVPNFPNLFMVGGPHTFLGHGGSVLYSLEVGVAHIAQLLMTLAEGGHRSLEVRADVCDDYNRRIDEEHERLIWTHPGMTTWYRNRHGRIVAMTPWRGVDYWAMTHEVDLDDYIVDGGASQ